MRTFIAQKNRYEWVEVKCDSFAYEEYGVKCYAGSRLNKKRSREVVAIFPVGYVIYDPKYARINDAPVGLMVHDMKGSRKKKHNNKRK